MLHVYVPRNEDREQLNLPPGAALLGRRGSSKLQVVKTADRYERFADTVRRAERGEGKQMELPLDQLIVVGYWDMSEGVLRLSPAGARPLSAWIGQQVHRGQLEASDSRDAQRRDARYRARRYDMQGRPDLAMRERERHGIHHW